MSNLTAPTGMYGVWCEPKGRPLSISGHPRNPVWIGGPMGYESAVEEADRMNRMNKEWHYQAKPIPV